MCKSYTVFARSFLDHKPKGQVTDKFLKPEKNYTSLNFFCQSMGGLEILIWLICQDVFYSDTHLCLWLKGSAYLPLFTFKERNSGLFCPIFLKFTFDNFTSPVRLAILKFYLPGPNFTSLGHRACAIFRRLHTMYIFLYLSSCWISNGRESPLSLLSELRFCKLHICYIISSVRSIIDNKNVDRAFVYICIFHQGPTILIVCDNCRSSRL